MAKKAEKKAVKKKETKVPIRQRLVVAVWDWLMETVKDLSDLDPTKGGLKVSGLIGPEDNSIQPGFLVLLMGNLVSQDTVLTRVKVGATRHENVRLLDVSEILLWLSKTAPDGLIEPYVKLVKSLPSETVLGYK